MWTMKTAAPDQDTAALNETTLVLGANGKTGRRILRQLEERGRSGRIGSRAATPAFDWHDRDAAAGYWNL